MFSGKRDQGVDYFDDVMQREDAGIYTGAALGGYEGVHESVSPDGVQIMMDCRKCGKGHNITIEWQELYIVGSNGPGKTLLPPRGWQYSQNNHKLYPASVLCSKCREPLCPQFSPDEARDRVNDAAHRGLIPMEALAQWKGQVDSFRAQNG